MSSLRWIDLVVIGLYFGAMVVVGWIFSRRVKTTEGYFVGNRSYPGSILITRASWVTCWRLEPGTRQLGCLVPALAMCTN
jgi:Na+/proline symporter